MVAWGADTELGEPELVLWWTDAPVGLPVGVLAGGVVALLTAVFSFGACVTAADGVCVSFLVAAVAGGGVVFLLAFLVGIGGLTIMCGLFLATFVGAVGFLVVGAALVVGFLSMTNSASRKKQEKTRLTILKMWTKVLVANDSDRVRLLKKMQKLIYLPVFGRKGISFPLIFTGKGLTLHFPGGARLSRNIKD